MTVGWSFKQCLLLQGDTKQAELYLKRALQEAIQGFGHADPHVASAENNLAELYRILGQYDRAEPLYDAVPLASSCTFAPAAPDVPLCK